MVALLFYVEGQRYGLDVAQVIRVVPYVRLRALPGVAPYVAGIFQYQDAMVPVIDMSRLICGRPAALLLSTRIILVRHPGPHGTDRALGLLAERATDSMDEEGKSPAPSGVSALAAPYLGGLTIDGGHIVQYVNVEQLLPLELREQLFVGE